MLWFSCNMPHTTLTHLHRGKGVVGWFTFDWSCSVRGKIHTYFGWRFQPVGSTTRYSTCITNWPPWSNSLGVPAPQSYPPRSLAGCSRVLTTPIPPGAPRHEAPYTRVAVPGVGHPRHTGHGHRPSASHLPQGQVHWPRLLGQCQD